MTGWIGISIGDVTGIGPEVTLKALAANIGANDSTRFLLIGDTGYIRKTAVALDLDLPLIDYQGPDQPAGVYLHSPLSELLPEGLATGSPAAAQAAIAFLKDGAQRCLRQELDALVTAPLSKESVLRTGLPFIGQTEYLSQLAGTTRTAMMLLGQDDRGRWLRVTLATTHLPLRHVADLLTQAKVELAIELAAQACRDLELTRARIGVCGLNPHAGEGGKLGDEEQTIIAPAVQAARARQFDAVGPLAADSLFYYVYRGDYDAVVAMYHDQGLVPLKMVGFESGVNWTLGLPFIRTSPDHGTAYDLAGKGLANPSSMQAAIRLARQLARVRG